ncbi:hypothetical protein rosag_00870 [Roseisolibacter agri]|uniref:Uncharacterized protein n=1 Tax=Roseisolibacter agri TaxID=2014610 RepID=A0AA37PZI7_9BACT|nr:hypothetical protein rosag_00870 [Roseisolibacter agri]
MAAPNVAAQLTLTVLDAGPAIRSWVASRAGMLGDTLVRGTVYGVWANTASNVFAVASPGTDIGEIWRYDGTRWALARASSGVVLYDIGGSGPSDVYAVGARGTVLRFDGSAWSTITTGSTSTLRGVFVAGPRLAFAVGDSGAVFRIDATGATRLNAGTTAHFKSIWASGAANVYVGGDSSLVLRFDGTSWRRIVAPATDFFNGLWGTATGPVYAASNNPRVYQVQTGTAVAQLGTFGTGFNDIAGSAANDIYAVGFGIARFDGTTWSTVTTPYPGVLFQSVTAVGDAVFVGGTDGLVLGRNGGGTWTPTNARVSWFGAAPIGASSALLVGSFGSSCRWDGATCTAVPTGVGRVLAGAWGDGAGNAIAVGDDVILQYGAGAWRSPIRSVGTLLGVHGTSASSALAVGDRIFRLAGTSWTEMTKPTANRLNAVWSASPTHARAVGANGTLLRLEGTVWRTESLLGRTEDLLTIWGADSANVFVGARAGAIYRFDGTAWTAQATTSQCNVWTLWGASATDVYAGTSCGEVLHYDGQAWTTQTRGPAGLWAIVGLPGGGAVGAGDNFLVLRGSPTASVFTATDGGTRGIRWSPRAARSRGEASAPPSHAPRSIAQPSR